jgi:coronin-1B/1C/6
MYTHSGAVLDVDFSPFRDNIFATSGEDCMVRCWRIPDEGADKEPALVELTGHSKKVGCIRFSPTVAQVIASAGADQLVKIWDISCGKDLCSVDSAQQQVVDIAWDHTGGIAAFASKDKHIRLCDPRACQVVQTYELAHEGSKSMKLTYMGESDYLLSTGFSKMSMRQYKLWDTRHTKTEVAKVDIDSASGVLMPFFDADTSLLYLAGKGDGNIRFLELSGGVIYPLGEYKSSNSQKGVGMQLTLVVVLYATYVQ